VAEKLGRKWIATDLGKFPESVTFITDKRFRTVRGYESWPMFKQMPSIGAGMSPFLIS
jgi:hypothetical protein